MVDGEKIGESDTDVVGLDVREGGDECKTVSFVVVVVVVVIVIVIVVVVVVVVIVVVVVVVIVTATVSQSLLSLFLMSSLASLPLSLILSLMD